MNAEELLRHRMQKFRSIGVGGYQEGVEVESLRKRNMKPSDANTSNAVDLESEIENLKKRILEAKEPSVILTDRAIEKLKEDLDNEMTKAFISMGMQDRVESLKLELSRSNRTPNQPLSQGLKEKADRIVQDFKVNLSKPGAYLGLKQKLQKLSTVSRLVELKENAEKLKVELNQKIPSDIIAKKEVLKKAQEKLSQGDLLDNNLMEEVQKTKKDLQEFLKSAGLEIVGITKRRSGTEASNLEKLNKEIKEEIIKTVNGTELCEKIEELKVEVAIDSSSDKVKKLKAEIKEGILAALSTTPLKEKSENLNAELRSSEEVVVTEGKASSDHNGRW